MVNDDFIADMKPRRCAGEYRIAVKWSPASIVLKKHYVPIDCVGVALDVLPGRTTTQRSSPDSGLEGRGKTGLRDVLIINPHTSYYSEGALFEMRYKAAETARLCLQDGVLRNRVAPQHEADFVPSSPILFNCEIDKGRMGRKPDACNRAKVN